MPHVSADGGKRSNP